MFVGGGGGGGGGGGQRPKRPQKAPISRALFGFFICVGPFGALELTSISSSLIYAKCFNDII